jgi:ribosome recycling factor
MAADFDALKRDLQRRMDGAMETLRKEFAGLRTASRQPGARLEPIRVECLWHHQPLNQVANISVGGPGLLYVQVLRPSITQAGRCRERDSGLGLNPMPRQVIRVPAPPLTQNAATNLAKTARVCGAARVRCACAARRMEQVKGWRKT